MTLMFPIVLNVHIISFPATKKLDSPPFLRGEVVMAELVTLMTCDSDLVSALCCSLTQTY